MHGIDDRPIYSNIGVTSSALAVQMFRNAQDLQQQNVRSALLGPCTAKPCEHFGFVSNRQTNSPELLG
ncbi:unnamed protein product [Sphagnum jensenii]|uniref:Uncharacterized protein n=1 Tax=Sphagnum jensenii TaxID=128206 RepID=A0ABP0XGX4_9BRYO